MESTFGERLKHIRNDRGLTQKELAEKLKIHTQQLQKYERGTQLPGHDIIVGVSQVLDISADYLLRLSDTPRRLSDCNF
jgi:Predicted transcriptional regulators